MLRSVGYFVDVCSSLREFHASIEQRTNADAVLVTAQRCMERRQIITLTRENSHAGLVLFASSYSGADEQEFDLVIPPQMRPEDWVRQIADVITKSRALNATATVIREQSALLRKDSEIARLKSRVERERSAVARAKGREDYRSNPPRSDPRD